MLLRRRRAPADVLRPVAMTAVLLAAQGAVGAIQYALEVPAEIVWVHVALAALTWLAPAVVDRRRGSAGAGVSAASSRRRRSG